MKPEYLKGNRKKKREMIGEMLYEYISSYTNE
jgi:hypothetical protein